MPRRSEQAANRRERARGKRERRRDRDRQSRGQELRKGRFRWWGAAVLVVLVIGGILGRVGYLVASSKNLPPTSLVHPHTEALPPQQINTEPIPMGIQIHVMERNDTHRDGQMLVQYNCEDYECEPDLIQNLTELVERYPPQVYLAPFPRMDAKIALAAPGALVTLEAFDEGKIREIRVIAGDLKFDASRITVRKGERVRFTVNSRDIYHTFPFEVNGRKINLDLQRGDRKTTEVVTFDTAQEVAFWCEPHRSLGMRGRIMVTE